MGALTIHLDNVKETPTPFVLKGDTEWLSLIHI